MHSVTVNAFAKINLTLNVFGTRADGLHDVRTVLQTIDLHDRVTCIARPGPLRLRCRAKGVPGDRTNLVWRAAAALWHAAGRPGEPRDVSIVVTKRIPACAGLGGGSSDAAATLMALASLWKLDITPQNLAAVAAGLGADVPFFLSGGAALGVGRGDEIYPLPDLPRWWTLIVTPPFGVSTAEAYAWLDSDLERASPAPALMIDPRLARTWLGRIPALSNDLEPPVARRRPEIAETVAALRGQGALYAAMSGSGSAVFGLFVTEAAAKAAQRRVRRGGESPQRGSRIGGPGWTRAVARLLPRAGFERLARPRESGRLRVVLPLNEPLVYTKRLHRRTRRTP